MSGPGRAAWPGGARAALSISFDNLGEAAEIELGARAADDLGGHPSVTDALPAILDLLAASRLRATFFVEGLNAEVYPAALTAIAESRHEVAYHAWRHEQWAEMTPSEQSENLTRGLLAFERLNLDVHGMRPPGGLLGSEWVDVLRPGGLRYCSPGGSGIGVAGENDELAVLPFRWEHVDASCVLPTLGEVRRRISGSPDPIEPEAYLGHLRREVDRLLDDGGFATFVFHPFMLDWLGAERLGKFLEHVDSARRRGLWVASCERIADHVLEEAPGFRGGATLDWTGWSG